MLLCQVLLQKDGEKDALRFELNDVIRLGKRRDGCRELVLHRESDDGGVEPTLSGNTSMLSCLSLNIIMHVFDLFFSV